jgi:hypothetical protein
MNMLRELQAGDPRVIGSYRLRGLLGIVLTASAHQSPGMHSGQAVTGRLSA